MMDHRVKVTQKVLIRSKTLTAKRGHPKPKALVSAPAPTILDLYHANLSSACVLVTRKTLFKDAS